MAVGDENSIADMIGGVGQHDGPSSAAVEDRGIATEEGSFSPVDSYAFGANGGAQIVEQSGVGHLWWQGSVGREWAPP
jgi:hypothetical protein